MMHISSWRYSRIEVGGIAILSPYRQKMATAARRTEAGTHA